MNARKITLLGVLIALSLVLNIVDSLIPSFLPGMKLGLANIVIIIILYGFGFKEAFMVNLLRVYLGGLLKGTIFQMPFFMSLAGAMASLLVMWILKITIKKLHVVGVSVIGSFVHVSAQILVAMAYLNTASIVYYLPFLMLSSIVTGIFIGLVSNEINKRDIIKKQRQKYNF